MKKNMVVVLTMFTFFLTGCSFTKSFTFNVGTGDKIEISLKTKSGEKYDIFPSAPVKITKDDITVGVIGFCTYEEYVNNISIIRNIEGYTILEEGENNGVAFILFKFENENKIQFGYNALVKNSMTGIVFENNISQESLKEAFEHLTFKNKILIQ